jgi:hypothetical protein
VARLVRSRIVQDAAGIPAVITVDGNDYLKNEIAERFSIEKGKAVWKNKVEQGERSLAAPAFYLSQSGTPAELPMLAKAGFAAPGHKLALLPSGEARVEALDVRTVRNGDASKQVQLYVVYGLGYQPTTVWLDDKGDFFASLDSWVVMVPEGWEARGAGTPRDTGSAPDGASQRAGKAPATGSGRPRPHRAREPLRCRSARDEAGQLASSSRAT